METKVAVLESRIANLEILLKEMRNQAADNQEKIISLLSLSKEKSGENSHNKGGNSDEEGMIEEIETMEVAKPVTVVGVKSEPKKENEREEQVRDHKERGRRIASGLDGANVLRCEQWVEGDPEIQRGPSDDENWGRPPEEEASLEELTMETPNGDAITAEGFFAHNLRNQAVSFTIEGCHTQSGDEEETQPEAPPEALPEEPPPKEGDDGTTVDAVGLDCDGGVPLLSLALIFSDRECEEKMTVSTDCFPGNVDSVSLVLGQADPFEIKKVFQEKRGAIFPVGLLPSITNTHTFSHVYLEHFSTTRQRCFTVDTFQGLVMSLISDPSLSSTHLKAVYIEISSFGKYVECTEKGKTTLAIKRVEELSPATFFWVVKYTNHRCYINGLQLLFKGEGKQIKLLVGVSRRYSNGFGQLINISILVMHPLVHKWNTGGTQQDRSIMGSATTCHGNQTPHHQHSTPINNEERCLKIESDRENKKLHPSANEFLIWKQCIGGEIGVAKGNHCLHAEIVSSVYSNHINLETLLLQHPMEKQGWVIKKVVATTIYGTQTTLPDIRGLLNALPQLSRSGGIFAAFIMNVNEAQFPSLSLEDKAGFHGAGSDRHLLLLFTRRVNSSLQRRIRILIEGEIGRKNNIIFRK